MKRTMRFTASGTLVLCDLDGTLLNAVPEFAVADQQVLRPYIDAGLAFVVATARGPGIVKSLLNGFEPALPIVSYGGAVVFDPVRDSILKTTCIDAGHLEALYQALRACRVHPMVFQLRDGRDFLFIHEASATVGLRSHIDDLRGRGDSRIAHGLGFDITYQTYSRDIISLSAFGTRNHMCRLAEAAHRATLGECQAIVLPHEYSSDWFVMIYHRDATKSHACRWVVDQAGLSGRRIIAFGDSDNDRELFSMANHKVAVANAGGSLKGLADEVCGANVESGVVRWIRDNVALT
ncbi:MAG: HAD hydrolase family protein [Chitinivibrionales bacterium]|nr:HAD hydrolase family protein [Chitinivibrionales bacterium]